MGSNLQQLIDMGIDPATGEDALTRCNNDVEEALNFLFAAEPATQFPQEKSYQPQESLEPLSGYQEQSSFDIQDAGYSYPHAMHVSDSLNNTTPITVPDELKKKLESYQNKTAKPEPIDYDKKIADYGYYTQNNSMSLYSSNDVVEVPPVYDVYSDIRRTKRADDTPPVLLSNKIGLFESVYAPLFMILSEIPAFREVALSHEFSDYGYAPNWWRTERCSTKTEIVQEVQRLLAFLDVISLRSFASIKNLTEASHKDNELLQSIENCESINEFMPVILCLLKTRFTKLNSHLQQEKIDQLFTSYLKQESIVEGDADYDSDDEDSLDSPNSIYAYPIESEYFNSNIYHTFHTLLWGDDLSRLGKLNIKTVSDIITICFENTGDVITGGLDLPSEFYPQVYLQQHSKEIKRKQDELRVIDRRIQKTSSQIFQLRSYKGRPIPSFLDTVQKHLSSLSIESSQGEPSVSDALNNLTEINDTIANTKQALADQLAALQTQKRAANIYDIDYLTQDFEEKLEPWILTGVIVQDNQFCYLKKVGNELKWFFVTIDSGRNKDFEIKECSFEFVQQSIQVYSSKDFSEGLVLIYVKESVFKSKKHIPLPSKLVDFINRDNSQLMDDLEQLGRATVSSSDESDQVDLEDEISSEESDEQSTSSGESDEETQGQIAI